MRMALRIAMRMAGAVFMGTAPGRRGLRRAVVMTARGLSFVAFGLEHHGDELHLLGAEYEQPGEYPGQKARIENRSNHFVSPAAGLVAGKPRNAPNASTRIADIRRFPSSEARASDAGCVVAVSLDIFTLRV